MKCDSPLALISAIRADAQSDSEEHGIWVALIEHESRELVALRCTMDSDGMGETLDGLSKQYEGGKHHLVFAHEHPTENPMPGAHDSEMTQLLLTVGMMSGFGVADHVIFTSDSLDDDGQGTTVPFSFAASGLLTMLAAGSMGQLAMTMLGQPSKRKAVRKLPDALQRAVDEAKKRQQNPDGPQLEN